ncbi:MAG TPA: hypothetical protein VF645_08690 [Allosphingosinicella sp.]
MGITLILVGLGCVIGAIVGGGVKLSHLEIAKFSSVWRQTILAGFGLFMMLIGGAIHFEERPVDAERPKTGEARVAEAGSKSEPRSQLVSSDEQRQPIASPQSPGISGAWTDVDRNRIVFDLEDGTFVATPAGSSVNYTGKVRAADGRLEWRVDGGGLCRGVIGSNGRSMSGTCADWQTGEEIPIILNRED